MERGSHGYGERSLGRYHVLANEGVWHGIPLWWRGRNHGALIRHSCASTHMRTIDLMADLDLDYGDTKSNCFEFQTFFSLSDSPLVLWCGCRILDCTRVGPHPRDPHVTFRGSPTSTTFKLPFTPFLSLTYPLFF